MENKFLNAQNHLYLEDRWLDYKDVSFVPAYSSITNTADINISTYITPGIGLLAPYIVWTLDINNVIENIKKGFYSFIDSMLYTNKFDDLKQDIKQVYETVHTVGVTVGPNKNDAVIVDAVLDIIKELHPDKKIPSKPIIFVFSENADNEEILSQIRHLRLKYKNDIDIIAGYLNTPFAVSKSIDLGVNGVVSNFTENDCGLTDQLRIYNTIFAKQSNVKYIVNCDCSSDAKTFAAGADIILTNKNTYQMSSYITKLKNDMKSLNCKTLPDLYNKTRFRTRG
jgi:vacuolar-type H+-ATPase subunit E/Vma4